jgi:hypothetical protein
MGGKIVSGSGKIVSGQKKAFSLILVGLASCTGHINGEAVKLRDH